MIVIQINTAPAQNNEPGLFYACFTPDKRQLYPNYIYKKEYHLLPYIATGAQLTADSDST